MGKIQKFEELGALYTEDCTYGTGAKGRQYGYSGYYRLLDTPYGIKYTSYGYVESIDTYMGFGVTEADGMYKLGGVDKYSISFRIGTNSTDLYYYIPISMTFKEQSGTTVIEVLINRDNLSITHNGTTHSLVSDTLPTRNNDMYSFTINVDTTNNTIKVYRGGVLINNTVITLSPLQTSDVGVFTRYGLMASTEFPLTHHQPNIGTTSDIMMFDRLLTEDEIQAYAKSNMIDYDLNMIHSYDFDNLTTVYNKGVLETGSGLVRSNWGMHLMETEIGTGIYSDAYGEWSVNAIDFDSPVIPTGDSKPFTFTMWTVFDGWPNGDDRRFFCNYNDSDTGVDCYIAGGGHKLVFRHLIGGVSNIWLNSSEDFPVSKLTHVTFTWDGTGDTDSIKLYINGIQDGADTPRIAGNIDETPVNLHMFNKPTEYTENERLNGIVTSIKVFDKVLTPSEIKHLYKTELIGRN